MTGPTREKSPVGAETLPAVETIPPTEVAVVKEIAAHDERPTELSSWKPKTYVGKAVKEGKITDIDQVLDQGLGIREAQIVDSLLPGLESDLLMIGQSKGKFGGGAERVFRQTQKKTSEGNKPSFATMCIVGNRNGYIGVGYGKARETVPAREKALRNAKLNLVKVMRGCGSWQCGCKGSHSIPFTVEGRSGSVRIKLMPAPKGTGLAVAKECQKILALAGFKDVWSYTRGQTRSAINLVNALMEALSKLTSTKVLHKHVEHLGIKEGKV